MGHIFNSTGVEIFKADIVRGEGCYLYDVSNQRYIDFESGVWCTALGHNHWRINQAIQKQLTEISHLGYRFTHAVVEEAAARLLETVHLVEGKCIFLSSGSEAVEMGVQIARRLTGRPLLVTLSNSYLAAFGSAGWRSSDEWHLFDWSGCKGCQREKGCDPECEQLRGIPWEMIGGVVFEPGNTSGRVLLPPMQLVQKLEEIVRRQQGLVVVDEVTTGFGRTGMWYGFEHYGLKPDIVAVGKGMGNGYPVSAVVMTEEIARALEESQFRYAQSHQNDALGCAVAGEVIVVMQEEGLVEQSRTVGAVFLEELQGLAHKHECVKEVRGRGLMMALEFEDDDEHFSLQAVHRELFARGFLVGCVPAARLFRFYPPLVVRVEEVQELVQQLDEILP